MQNQKTIDMTEGNILKQLVLFSLPMMGAQLLQVTYSVVDAMVIGNYVGAAALGAVSIPGPVIWMANSVAAGIGGGANVVVAQLFGAKKPDEIRKAGTTALALGLLAGMLFTLACVLVARPLITGFLNAPPTMVQDSCDYLQVYSLGFVFLVEYHVCYGILRALGESKGSLLFLLVSAVLNVVLDLWFVAGLGWGVSGAALASSIAQAVACLTSAVWLFARFKGVRPVRGTPMVDKAQFRLILKVGVPIMLQMATQQFGFLLLQRMVNNFGPASIEGFATMGRTEEIMHIPTQCFALAIASFAGQNMGAGQPQRVARGYRQLLAVACGVSVVLGVLMFSLSSGILSMYNIHGDSFLRAKEHLDLMCLLLLVFTVQKITNGVLQGSGDVRVPVISSFTDLVIRLLATFVMSLTPIGFRSIYLSAIPAWLAACAISLIRYKSDVWKTKGLAQQV